jgi:Prokaryotic cytochrome b561
MYLPPGGHRLGKPPGISEKGDEMNVMAATLTYLRNRQSAQVVFLHIVVLLSAISQIIVSNFMGFSKTGAVSGKLIEFYATWTHIITGLALLPIAIVFAVLVLQEHGFKYFFPYLFGDFRQLQSDIGTLKKFQLPEPEGGGLAAVVKGLGLGALFLALLSGLAWFLSWHYAATWSHTVKELHESLVGLVEAYIIGHGGMGLLHIYLTTRSGKTTNDRLPQ